MENQMRMEYLFPNINNERIYKWLENAPLSFNSRDAKIADFTFDEFVQKFNYDATWKCYSSRKRLMKAMELYDNWKNTSCNYLPNLDCIGINWDNDLTHKLALHLNANPLELPYFLQKSSCDIIGLFLDERDLSEFSHSKFYRNNHLIFLDDEKSDWQYRRDNFQAKYKLSLFLSVLNNLLDLGVNLSEYKFGCLEYSKDDNSFNKLDSLGSWYEPLISKIPKSYTRRDGQSFTRKELINYISFSNLNEFFDKVMELVDVEYFYSLVKEPKTIDPNQVCPARGIPFDSNDMLVYPDEKLVDVKDACKNMQKKLKHVALNTKIRILTRKLDDIKNLIEKYTKESRDDYNYLKEVIENFNVEIADLPSDLKEKFTTMVNELLKNRNMQVTLDGLENLISNLENNISSIKGVSDVLPNSEFKNLSSEVILEKLDNLEKRMAKTEEKMNIVEQSLLNYIEHGGELKIGELSGLSTEEKLRIVSNAKATTTGAKIRKKILLGFFKIGASALIASALVLKATTPTIDNLDNQSTSTEKVDEMPNSNISEDSKELPDLPIDSVSVNSVDNKTETDWEEHKEIIVDVIRGDYGSGNERKEKLTQDGYDYNQIQSYVNQVMYGNIDITEDNSPVLRK